MPSPKKKTEAQHTPGPWTADLENCQVWRSELRIADLVPRGVASIAPRSERPANARLIAAAPEMLEEHERVAGSVSVLLAALADGRSSEPEFRDTLAEILSGARAAISKARGGA